MNWSSPFDEPIKLADGRKLVTLKDAGSLDPGRDARRPDDVRADRRHAGIEPSPRS
jgi:hypothetical protein